MIFTDCFALTSLTHCLFNPQCCVRNNYRENPFHNFRHGFCVAQTMYTVIWTCDLQDLLSPVDIVSLMVAALCHDLDHPGLSNVYQVNAGTELAARYLNKSPLENHHWAITSQILSHEEANIFMHCDQEEVQRILQAIMELILATDMTHHSNILRNIQQIQGFNASDMEHLTALMMGLIKLCDISNEARPAAHAEIWADALFQEYFLQSDREKAEGLPVTPYMDPDTVSKAQSQSSFISCLIVPLCQALGQVRVTDLHADWVTSVNAAPLLKPHSPTSSLSCLSPALSQSLRTGTLKER
uniref:PDEase domain-containing protein n=1 Tax=Leptobrachium leishanense TaxID=445787 RepID=A0A8C5LW95_9ANUR